MGVKNLWDILECCKKTLPLHHLQNKRVCIDLSCWMVQLQNVNKTHCAMKEKLYLRGLFHRVRALIALNCSIVFVTDGAIPAVKISSYRKRLNSVNESARDDIDGRKTLSLRRNTGSEFSCMIREAKALGLALGIPCLDGVEEGEAQCAVLNSESICDGCFSSDSDIFLFGARTVYRDICLGEGGYVVCYEMADIEEKLGFGRHSMIVLALLLGSDYSQGVYGFGPESACQVTKSIGEDTILQYLQSEDVSFMKSLKTFKKHGHFSKGCGKENIPYHKKEATGNELHLERENEFLGVIKAYMKPKCHLVDSDPVYRVLAVHPFRRTELQQICAQFFGWPPEKTDEYILPKIAERDLRRFTNLRSSSSRLGVILPLHKMPVKCPVSEVLKHRRVQGKECFEVSWEEFDGLKTSVVPADLVESACPERISEFEEKIAQKKKPKNRKPRSKKSEDQVSMVNLDQKLQQLLLDIESQNNGGSADSSSSHTSISGSSKTIDSLKVSDSFDYEHQKNNIDQKLEKLSLDIEATDNVRSGISRSFSCTSVTGNNSIVDLTISDTFDHGRHRDNDNESICALNSHSNLPSTMGVDVNNVIDLSSPSPATSSRFVSKFQGNKGQATVIDLIDSDTEMSPEHAQKAVKLRQFLASIREDMS